MSSALVSAPVSLPLAFSSPAPVRARATKRRKRARQPQPQTPADFFSPESYTLLVDLLAMRAKQWLWDNVPPVFYHARDSEPLWGAQAGLRCSGTTLRIACRRILLDCLCMDLERGLRLLTLKWTAQGTTTDGHDAEEWRLSLAGVLWRVGQLFRELTRRSGEERAREVVRLAMEALWQ